MVQADHTIPRVKHPHIKVALVGEDGNAFAIMGRVTRAMKRAKLPKEEIDAFMRECTSGDYNNLLATCMRWVDCDPGSDDEGE